MPLVPPLGKMAQGALEPSVAGVSQSVHVLSAVEMGLCLTGPGDRTSLLLVSAVWWHSDGTRALGRDHLRESFWQLILLNTLLMSQENEMNFG